MEASVESFIEVLNNHKDFDDLFFCTFDEAASTSKAESKIQNLAKKGQDVEVQDGEEDPSTHTEKKNMLSSYFFGREFAEEGRKAYRGRKA
ncbi:unnamed protein product [Cuscuta campestris]|uniref:Uncharacterized protein n=1 Tax=Cuscuta campestris TaxID=132261 RepID=A0A484M7U3_9ASTE|nr:unnamed protein product [Cuscuta campestris]